MLQFYVPLAGQYSYRRACRLAQLVAQLTHLRLPELASLERSPQNRKGQTLMAPYSLRPRPGMMCALGLPHRIGTLRIWPLTWSR